MPPFVPLVMPIPLPKPGSDIERPIMDWKVKPSAHAYEKAKDVAAFANRLGGTLLIGAKERDGQLDVYVGMSPAEAGRLRDEFSKAVADRCDPPPAITPEEYKHPDDPTKRIVAINVEPSLNLVGVRVAGDKAKEGYGGPAYVFPVRNGTDAIYLEPGQLAMFMTPSIRRVAIMLGKIQVDERVDIINAHVTASTSEGQLFVGVFEEENLAKFKNGGAGIHLPLDRILSVYKNRDGRWTVLTDNWRGM